MNQPFALNQSYDRSSLLAFVGSMQGQSGIIWGTAAPGVVICTSGGRHGVKAGYADTRNEDGTWTYFGQGEKGDQNPNAFANRLLIEGTRSVLFFQSKEPSATQVRASGSYKKQYIFVGEFCVGSWEVFNPLDGRRIGDQIIKFILVPVSGDQLAIDGHERAPIIGKATRDLLIKFGSSPQRGTLSLKQYFIRIEMLRRYAKDRARGVCEYCEREAPFKTSKGEPFLEVHHILRLADDGPDSPKNVAALCPNCHRAAHYAHFAGVIRSTLIDRIGEMEKRLDL